MMGKNRPIRLLAAVPILLVIYWLFVGHALAQSKLSSEGFVLRGVLENAASDGSPYYMIGDHALVLTVPRDSALVPGLRGLEGKKVVISLYEDVK